MVCRTPEWLKKMFASVSNGQRNGGPVFRFFMDLGDAGTIGVSWLSLYLIELRFFLLYGD